jgi:type I restriction enzyme, S subunit
MSPTALAAGWASSPLGELVQPTRVRVAPEASPDLPYIGLENIEAHSMRLLGTTAAASMKSAGFMFGPGEVLYGRLRPYLNKVYRASFPGICSAEFIVLRPGERITGPFLQYVLNSTAFVAFAQSQNAGDRPRVSFDQLAPFEVPYPQVDEQTHIVQELESRLARIDEAANELNRVTSHLVSYQRALLEQVVTGGRSVLETDNTAYDSELETAEQLVVRARALVLAARAGRQRHSPRADAATAAREVASSVMLPAGWVWARWGDIAVSQNGRSFPSADYTQDGIRLLRPGNLHSSGKVEWNNANTKRLPRTWAETATDYILGPDELVMNLTAQSLKDEFLGRVCVTDGDEPALLNQRIARLCPQALDPTYVFWVLKSPLFRRFVRSLNTGSLIQHMFTSQLDEFMVPVPPLAEQRAIVSYVEQQVSVMDHVADQVASSLRRTVTLRRATLQAALRPSPRDRPVVGVAK